MKQWLFKIFDMVWSGKEEIGKLKVRRPHNGLMGSIKKGEAIFTEYKKGRRVPDIAAQYNLSHATVYRIIRQFKKRMKMSGKHIEKYSGPTKLDKAPQGTTWANIMNETEPDIFIQLNKDEASPNWQRYGDFLAIAYKTKILNRGFVDTTMKLYEENYKNNMAIANKLMDEN